MESITGQRAFYSMPPTFHSEHYFFRSYDNQTLKIVIQDMEMTAKELRWKVMKVNSVMCEIFGCYLNILWFHFWEVESYFWYWNPLVHMQTVKTWQEVVLLLPEVKFVLATISRVRHENKEATFSKSLIMIWENNGGSLEKWSYEISEIWWTVPLNFSKNCKWFDKLYQTLERLFHPITYHRGV